MCRVLGAGRALGFLIEPVLESLAALRAAEHAPVRVPFALVLQELFDLVPHLALGALDGAAAVEAVESDQITPTNLPPHELHPA